MKKLKGWLSLAEYSKKYGIKRSTLYLRWYMGRIPKSLVKKVCLNETLVIADQEIPSLK